MVAAWLAVKRMAAKPSAMQVTNRYSLAGGNFFFFLPAAVLFGGAIGRKSRQHLRLLEIQDNKHGGGSCEGIPRGGDTRRENIKKVISQPEAVTRKEKKT